MNDSDLKHLLEAADGPLDPSDGYVDELWAELECLAGPLPAVMRRSRSIEYDVEPGRPIDLVRPARTRSGVSGLVTSLGAAAAVLLLGLSTVFLSLAHSPGAGPDATESAGVQAVSASLSRTEVGLGQANTPMGRACVSFAVSPVAVVLRIGAVQSGQSGYSVQADVTKEELHFVAEAISRLRDRLDGLGQVDEALLDELDRADSAMGNAALMLRMGELELAYDSIREARRGLENLASDPALLGCLASTGLVGPARQVSTTPMWD